MKKVFILGAGASCDFGFPSSMKLMQEIQSLWNSPQEEIITNYARIIEQLKKLSRFREVGQEQIVVKKIKKLSDRLYFSGADSIDDFLSQCKDEVDVQFGKLTILKIILEREQKTEGFGDEALFKWEENWLRGLFGEEFRFQDIEALNNKLSKDQFYFVIFNYDRCVENFLYTAIQNYYGLTEEETKNIINKIVFYHVYGHLAPLGWQSKVNTVSFGDTFGNEFDYLYRFVSNIEVINEDRDKIEKIRDKVSAQILAADKVYILGFGFQDANWYLLGIDKYKNHRAKGLSWPPNKFHYTNFGLSKRRKEHIQQELFGFTSHDVDSAKSYDVKIYDFMHHNYI